MTRPRDAQARGHIWEIRAKEYLLERGIEILVEGYRCRLGELDLIGSDGNGLIIVEVRARSRSSNAIDSIGPNKQRRIINATRHFLMRHPNWSSRNIRFDVVTVDAIDTPEPRFRWIKNAFEVQ